MKVTKTLFLLILVFVLSSCNSNKPVKEENINKKPEIKNIGSSNVIMQTQKTSNSHVTTEEKLEKSIKEQIKGINSTDTIEIYKYPDNKYLYVALCIRDKGWFEGPLLICYQNNKIIWSQLFEDNYDIIGCSNIISIRFPKLNEFNHALIEIYEANHQGNGSIILYDIKNNMPVKILKSFAVDYNWEQSEYWKGSIYQGYTISTLIKNKKLDVQYKDLNNDGCTDVKLSGTIEYYNDGIVFNKPDIKNMRGGLIGSEPWTKVYVYNRSKKVFEKDNTRYSKLTKFKYMPYYKDID